MEGYNGIKKFGFEACETKLKSTAENVATLEPQSFGTRLFIVNTCCRIGQ